MTMLLVVVVGSARRVIILALRFVQQRKPLRVLLILPLVVGAPVNEADWRREDVDCARRRVV